MILINTHLQSILHMFAPAESIFLAIFVESIPFVLIGAILSSIIHEFISADRIVTWIPNHNMIAILLSGLLGLVAPNCDCGTIPVVRSLLAKRVPKHAVITYGLSAPVINPVTIMATFVAFGFNLRITLIRIVLTYAIACTVGFVLGSEEQDLPEITKETCCSNKERITSPPSYTVHTMWHHIQSITDHTTSELFGIIGFLICSAAVASIYEVYHTQHFQFGHLHTGILSVMIMMIFGIVFSLCSNADAFVARSFATSYSIGSVMAFMLISQLADLRNLFLIPRTFGLRLGINIIALCMLFTLICGVLI